jgi:uncharacterized protein YjgD (DUF1641 family)
MENKDIQLELQEIHQKLDFISEQMRDYQRKQREIQELKDDMALITKDIFNAAVEELQDVAPYFDTNDLIHLIKKLLRNTRNINKVLTQMESAEDLYRDLKPLSKHIFGEVLETLNEFDQKGYFEFIRESLKIFDSIVTSFSVEDVILLRENIKSILLTIKGMTQPEMLGTINNALEFFKKMDIDVDKNISYFGLLKEMRNPEVKQGIIYMLQFVKNMARSNQANIQEPIKQ